MVVFTLGTHNPSGMNWAINISLSGYASHCSSSIKMGTRWIVLLHELSYIVCLRR